MALKAMKCYKDHLGSLQLLSKYLLCSGDKSTEIPLSFNIGLTACLFCHLLSLK